VIDADEFSKCRGHAAITEVLLHLNTLVKAMYYNDLENSNGLVAELATAERPAGVRQSWYQRHNLSRQQARLWYKRSALDEPVEGASAKSFVTNQGL
jgi:hypothetical protein